MIRLAIIGSGIFVKETYVPNIKKNSHRVQLTAILSRRIESIETTLAILRKDHEGSDAEEAIKIFVGSDGESDFFASARKFCDAVVICVPIPLLASYIERCLEVGLHILSEKPVAMNSFEAKRLISIYRQENIEQPRSLWYVAENYRFEPAIQYARGLVQQRNGKYPKSFTLLALRQQSFSSKYALTEWRQEPKYHGSYVLDGGIHFVAMLRFILGDEIRNIHSTYEEKSVVECGAAMVCQVGDALGTFQCRYGAFPRAILSFDVYWEDATLSLLQVPGGYEVSMTGKETEKFSYGGLEAEFNTWLDDACGMSSPNEWLSPEQSLADLLVVEELCHTKL